VRISLEPVEAGGVLNHKEDVLNRKDEDERLNRRSLIRAAALGILGLGLAQHAEGLTRPAYAADGDYIRVGGTFFGSSSTYLSSSISTQATFQALNSGNYIALEGDSGSSGIGVYGNAGLVGVRGYSDSGTGVSGTSNNGRGVVGTSSTGTGVQGATEDRPVVTTGKPAGVVGIASTGNGVVGATDNFDPLGTAVPAGVLGVSYGSPALAGLSQSGHGVNAACLGSAEGILGWSMGGIGVRGICYGSNPGVRAESISGPCLVARPGPGNSANLQEWQDQNGTVLSMVTKDGDIGMNDHLIRLRAGNDGNHAIIYDQGVDGPQFRGFGGFVWKNGSNGATERMRLDPNGQLGIGAIPQRQLHLQGSNACFRMDRDVNSSAFILTRTAAGDFSTIWKTFYVGVDASGVDNGYFFIGDRHNGVSGNSDKRLIIDNSGNIVPPTDNTGNIGTDSLRWAKIRGAIVQSGDLVFENGIRATEDGGGLAFKSPTGTRLAVLDLEGNLHIKGKVLEDL
jgi:hypothetical protein